MTTWKVCYFKREADRWPEETIYALAVDREEALAKAKAYAVDTSLLTEAELARFERTTVEILAETNAQ